jgi:hypothetical protein
MKTLRSVSTLLTIAIALWALAFAVYFLVFAKVSYATETVSVTQGEPPVQTRTSGQVSWISSADPTSIVVILALSGLLGAGALAAWLGSLAVMAGLSLVMILASYATGFTVGVFYFPGAGLLTLRTALSAVDNFIGRRKRPDA